MTDRYTLRRIRQLSSDECYEYNCSDCLNESSVCKEAFFYCPECDKYLCRQCYICDHDVLGRRSMDKWGQKSGRPKFDPCQQHDGNTIQLYCQSHDTVCCPVCSQSDHKSCGDSVYIPLVPECNPRDNKAGLDLLRDSIDQVKDQANTVSKDIITTMADVDDTELRLVMGMTGFRARVEAMLDEMEKKTNEDIAMFKASFEAYNSQLEICDSIQKEMQELQQKLNAAVQDEPLLFSRIKQGQKKVDDRMHFLGDLARSVSSKTAVFEPHAEIENVLQGHQGLGKVFTCSSVDEPVDTDVESQIVTPGLDLVEQGQGMESQSAPSDMPPYTLLDTTSFQVNTLHDEKQCNIVDMCVVPSGNIVLTDYSNASLKMITSQNEIISQCSLEEPLGVCYTEAGQVAVALGINTIQFLSVGEQLTKTHSFTTDHDCHSLAYSNRCLFVTEKCGTAVYVYNLNGTRLRAITQSQYGEKLFSSVTRHIMASRDGSCLHITGEKGLATIDTRGHLERTFTSPDLVNGPHSACVDEDGNVFVGGYSSNSVLQVSGNTGRKLAEISSPSGAKEIVNALCFDSVSSRLLVASWNSDTMNVLHLSK